LGGNVCVLFNRKTNLTATYDLMTESFKNLYR